MSHLLRRPQVPTARSKCYSGECVAVFCCIISLVIKSARSSEHMTRMWGIDTYETECCTYSIGPNCLGSNLVFTIY